MSDSGASTPDEAPNSAPSQAQASADSNSGGAVGEACARRRVLLAGATGTIGRAVLARLLAEGYDVTAYGRTPGAPQNGVTWRQGHFMDAASIAEAAFDGTPYTAVISCLASRTGAPTDAWAVDHRANSHLLAAAEQTGQSRFVYLSAICVQKPKLAFQSAKLAFEAELQASGLDWTIIRPTAFFKSLSGQVARVQAGKPYLVFGDGALTACKPISDRDLAAFILAAIHDPSSHGQILAVGGPGPAITPRQMGDYLFQRTGLPPRFSAMPVAAMRAIAAALGVISTFIPRFRAKAELARIGLYYGTESMLFWDPAQQAYDANQTPEFGSDTLFAHYDAILDGHVRDDRGDHAVF